MTWNPLESPRGVEHDITYYRIEYRLTRTDTQNPQTIVHDTSSNDPSTIIDIPQDTPAMQVVEARVQGVTQIRREPDAFSFGPFSDYETEDDKPTPSPPPREFICTHLCGIYIRTMSDLPFNLTTQHTYHLLPFPCSSIGSSTNCSRSCHPFCSNHSHHIHHCFTGDVLVGQVSAFINISMYMHWMCSVDQKEIL